MEILTELPYGLPGKVYRSPMPYSQYFDRDWQVMRAYRQAGVEVVVVMTSWEEILDMAGIDLQKEYADAGMDVIYLPTPDFGIPDPVPFRQALEKALQAAREGKNVAIHCHAGLGRTGIFAACLAKVVFHLDGKQAFKWVRESISGAVENMDQLQFIEDFSFSED